MEAREIKFRIWNGKEMEVFILDNEFDCHVGWLKNSVLMQSTGLTDKNGVEIFEGDVHKTEPIEVDGEIKSSYLPVIFDNGAFWLDESFKKDGTYLTLLGEYDEPLNICGNIHEHPNLLK